jgi:hypothetical protein
VAVLHNGFNDGFATIKRDLVLAIDGTLFPEIQGNADTEVLLSPSPFRSR